MTLMYGQGGGSGDPITMPPDDYRLGGVRPLKLMLGTGTTAVEMWANIYPVSGSWPSTSTSSEFSTYGSHTIAASGTYTVTLTVIRTFGALTVTSRLSGLGGTLDGPSSTTSTVATTRDFPMGSVITFQASGSNGLSASGSWSVVRN